MTPLSRKKIIIALIVILFLAAAGVNVKTHFFSKPKNTFITANVVKMDLEDSVLASGTLKALKTVAVGAQVSGKLIALHVALGDKVKKGQLLAEIDPVIPQNSLKNAEAEVDNLNAQKRSKQALLKQYSLALDRQKQMIARDATARSDLESAQAQFDSAGHDIASLEAQIKKAIIAVDSEKANLEYTRINAPIDGTVISVDTQEGQTIVSTYSTTTLLTLANLDTMTVKAKISEADVVRVKPGLPTYFTLLGDADTRYHGKLRAIEPGPVSGVSSSTGTDSSTSGLAIYYYGLFEVPNNGNKLKVSMTTQVAVVINQIKQAICIPVSALGDKLKDGRYTVKVLTGDVAETRTIRTGLSDKVQVQVLDGVREGEKVVVGDSTPVSKTEAGPGGKN